MGKDEPGPAGQETWVFGAFSTTVSPGKILPFAGPSFCKSGILVVFKLSYSAGLFFSMSNETSHLAAPAEQSQSAEAGMVLGAVSYACGLLFAPGCPLHTFLAFQKTI